MICPWCKSEIDDDSWFCDQCGKELWICPKCGKPGRGKACIYDGSMLVKASEIVNLSSGTSSSNIYQGINQKISSSSELHLINRNLNLDLIIQDQDIIGRTVGRFTQIFSQYKKVSRQHCQFKFDPQLGWTVIDLGSTNGTMYENVPLKPNQPVPLKNSSYLIIANIEFYVEIRQAGEQTERL